MMSGHPLKPAEKWFHDGVLVCQRPAIQASLAVDLTYLSVFIEEVRRSGLHLTYAHLFVRAAALVLRDNPRLHKLLCGSRIHALETVDIGLSVSSDDPVTPVLIIKGAERKSLAAVAQEVIEKTPEARREQDQLVERLNRWGWVLPVGILRRAFLRIMGRSLSFRRSGSGTFQVSVLRGVDEVATSVFGTSALLVAGEVKDRVAVYEGKPAVRRMVTFTCCADHRVWNGGDCRLFLESIQSVLEGDQLLEEWRSSVKMSA